MDKKKVLKILETTTLIGASILVNVLNQKRSDEKMQEMIADGINERLKELPESIPSKEA